jgi:O-antigen/teichoic acid export membrane protein
MLLGLITNIFVVRKLSVNDYGYFSVALMLIGLITTFGFSWSSSSILYFGGREKANTGSLNKTFWARNLIIAFSLILTSIFFVLFKENINDYVGLDISYLILMWLYISVAEDYLSQYYLAVKRQILSSLLSITAKIIYLILIVIFSFDVRTLIILNIISHASVLIYIFGINKNDIGSYEFDKLWFKEILTFSLWQLFGFSGTYLINFGDTAVIRHFMSMEDVGVYNAAYKLFNATASFSFVISNYFAGSLSQYFDKKDHIKISQFYYKERFAIFGLSVIAHTLVIIFARPIIISLYGFEYVQAIPIFIILMIGSVIKYLSVFYMLYYNLNGKFKIQQNLNIMQAFLNLGLDILFIQVFGLIGPAIATVIAILVTFSISFIYCEKRIRFLANK